MNKLQRHSLFTTAAFCVLWMSLLCYSSTLSWADGFSERRAQVGLKLFRTLIAADLDIPKKLTQSGELPVVIVYASDENQAAEHQQQLQRDFSQVGNINLDIQRYSLTQLLVADKPFPAAVFVSEALKQDEREALVNLSIDQHIIVFSPYEGDVEEGVLAGLSVQATVKPLINTHTLQQGQFRIKSFYLKVAKLYE